ESPIAAIRLEISPRPGAETKTGKGKKRPGATVTLGATLKHSDCKEEKLAFYDADADHKEERYSSRSPILGVTDAWKTSTKHDAQTAVWVLAKPVSGKAGDVLKVSLGSPGLSSVRVSFSPFPGGDPLKSGIGAPLRQAIQKHSPAREAERDLVE